MHWSCAAVQLANARRLFCTVAHPQNAVLIAFRRKKVPGTQRNALSAKNLTDSHGYARRAL